jgi:cobalamin biosynthesis protein CobT
MSDRANAPIADVLALLVRERLTGDAPPEGARAVVDLFRDEVEAKAGPDLDRLMDNLNDQAAFGKVARAILRDLDLGDADIDPSESERRGTGRGGRVPVQRERRRGRRRPDPRGRLDGGDRRLRQRGPGRRQNRWWSPTRTPPR